ncbi:hypothetical protein LTV02_11895 [Nocardia yamanashiensis]|uniref:hypothetical protein n=1 Tax=Nocardia yamanashiensis TaxID=209247 RepID=UPI001E35AB5E|nr:hypothetical protein [Nocardia yamanashiensis]UGT46065.1 hypothetical protein LTV02_11895 [Nocardia yamanashiensis]
MRADRFTDPETRTRRAESLPGQALRIATVFTAAATAGLASAMPISAGWFASAPRQVDLMIRSVPLAMAAGAIVAVVVAATVASVNSRRAAWLAITVALLGILINHTGLPWLDIDSITTWNYIDSLWAGTILGSLPVVIWNEPPAVGAYLFGCVGSRLLGDLTQSAAVTGPVNVIERLIGGAPPIWLIAIALTLLLAYLLLCEPLTPTPPAPPMYFYSQVVAGLIAVVTISTVSTWMAHRGESPLVIAAGIALVIAAALTAALILPDRDGILLLLIIALTTSCSAVVTVPRPEWTDPAVLALAAIGLFTSLRSPKPWIAIAATATLAAAATLVALVGGGGGTAIAGVLAVGFISGYTIGAAVPPRATSAVVAIAILFVPAISVGLRGRSFGRVSYSPYWYRLPSIPTQPAPGVAALLITAGCALGILLLTRRPITPQTPTHHTDTLM